MRFDYPCPFCSEHDGNVVNGLQSGSDGFQVQCACGARGPLCVTETEAIEAWNSGVRNLQGRFE
ncbi:MAG: Lar family restriction alleviation protein [Candidatus Hydrogenedentes bacterium]|nr:Lar family restriction alleviation protein [Candidatus Hydrogenedentota bacterium]